MALITTQAQLNALRQGNSNNFRDPVLGTATLDNTDIEQGVDITLAVDTTNLRVGGVGTGRANFVTNALGNRVQAGETASTFDVSNCTINFNASATNGVIGGGPWMWNYSTVTNGA